MRPASERRRARHPTKMLKNMQRLGIDGDRRSDVVDPMPLMVRYLDGKPALTNDEREILLFALYMESIKKKNGLASKALKQLKKGTSWLRISKNSGKKLQRARSLTWTLFNSHRTSRSRYRKN